MADERGSDMDVISYLLSGSRWVWVTVAVIGGLAIVTRMLGG